MSERICPWWLGYLLASPLRRLLQNPEDILTPHVKPGMTVLDMGCAMGFFSLPMARLVGADGRVIAVDLQEKMIRSLRRRMTTAGLSARIETRNCTSGSLAIDDLAEGIDFALAFAVLHEMPDIRRALASICRSLRPGGRLLIAEPAGHVSEKEFRQTTAIAIELGLDVVDSPRIHRSRSALLSKKSNH